MSIPIFLSYAREDQEATSEVFGFLHQLGLDPFQDVEGLKGGEEWRNYILDKAQRSKIFLFLASACSLAKGGMIDEELEVARKRLAEDPTFRFITVRLDDAPLRDWMSPIQFLKFADPELLPKIVATANEVLAGNDLALVSVDGKAFINQRPSEVLYEAGGCSYQYSVPSISIVGDAHVSAELNSAIRGKVAETLLDMRGWVGLEPRWQTGDSMIVIQPIAADFSAKYIGLSFEHFAHFSGAAHPQHHFMTISIRRSPWSLKRFSAREEDKHKLADLVIGQLHGEEDSLWEAEQLKTSLMRFDHGAHSVMLERGVRMFFPDYVLGPYLRGCSVYDFDVPEIVELLDRDELDDQ